MVIDSLVKNMIIFVVDLKDFIILYNFYYLNLGGIYLERLFNLRESSSWMVRRRELHGSQESSAEE